MPDAARAASELQGTPQPGEEAGPARATSLPHRLSVVVPMYNEVENAAPLLDAVAGALVGELAGVLPIQGPANFGTYEAGVWAGASLYGGPSLKVAAPAVALHLFSLATAVIAGAIAYALSPRTPAVRPAEEEHV